MTYELLLSNNLSQHGSITSMGDKKIYMFAMTLGSLVGGYVPSIWGNHDLISMVGVFTTALGGFLGIFLAYKVLKG